jgi:MoaA/NifB/PqqE/SkfB family radical SAM enzyme
MRRRRDANRGDVMKPRITKAEVLITRRCNIKCGTCKVIEPALDAKGNPTIDLGEMSPREWHDAFDTIYNRLGATFIAIYGGEPMAYGHSRLCEVIESLSWHCRNGDKGFTVISNGIGLTESKARDLVAAGLDSWTSSVDTWTPRVNEIGDKYMQAKSQTGLSAIELMAGIPGVRDTCGIVTVTARNLAEVVPTVEWLCARGHWVGIDLLHYQRGDGEYSFSTTREQMEPLGLLLRREHLTELAQVADYLIANHERLKVFPTKPVLEMWKNPDYSIDLKWKCKPAHAITVDFDGSIGLCDDRMPTAWKGDRAPAQLGRAWHINDLREDAVWDDFVSWYAHDLEKCSGCFWSTHVMAVDAMNDAALREHYMHRRLPGEL